MWVKKFQALGIVVALGCFSAVSSAASVVSFSTQGKYDAGSYGSPVTLTIGDSSLQFTGLTNAGVDVDVPANNPVQLGTFVLSSTSNPFSDFSGHSFTLQVTQSLPGPGSGTFTALLSGEIKKNDNPNNDVEIDWASPTLTLPGSGSNNVTYTLTVDPLHIGTGLGQGSNPYTAIVYANITVAPAAGAGATTPVPVPAAVWSGLSVLGGLGLIGRVKRSRAARQA